MGSGLAGPLLFWEGGGMSEVRRFEMMAVPQVRSLGWRVYPKEENGKLDEEPQMKQVQGHGSIDGHDFDSPCG